MKKNESLYRWILLILALTPCSAYGQPSDGLIVGVPDVSSPVDLLGTLSDHNGGPVLTGERTALLTSRQELKAFFSPRGSLVRGPLPINWAQGQSFQTINWERHMVLAIAKEQGGDEVSMTRVVRRSTESGQLLEYVGVYATRKNQRANAAGSSAYSLAVVPRELKASVQRAFRVISKAAWDREHRDRILSLTRPASSDDGLPSSSVPAQQAGEQEAQVDEPVRERPGTIPFTVHASGPVGPNANRAEFVETLQQYKQFFQMGGQQTGARTLYYQGGERAVIVSNGKGSNRRQVRITKLVFDSKTDTLAVTVQRDRLPRHLSHVLRPWQAVKFDAAKLQGHAVKRILLLDARGRQLAIHARDGAPVSDAKGLGDSLDLLSR